MVLRSRWFHCFKVEKSFQHLLDDKIHLILVQPVVLSILWQGRQSVSPADHHVPVCSCTCCPLHRHQWLRRPSPYICAPSSEHTSCDFLCGRNLSPEVLLGSIQESLPGVTSDLDFCVCHLAPGQHTYQCRELPVSSASSSYHMNSWVPQLSPTSLPQTLSPYTPVGAVAYLR